MRDTTVTHLTDRRGPNGLDDEARSLFDAIRYSLDVGAKLHDLRVAQGLSGADLARRLGVTASTVSALEAGDADPTLDDLRAIAEALAEADRCDPTGPDGERRRPDRWGHRLADVLPIAEEFGVGEELAEVVQAALAARHAHHALAAQARLAQEFRALRASAAKARRSPRSEEAITAAWYELANLFGWARSVVDHVRRDDGRTRVPQGLLPALRPGPLRGRVEHAFEVLLAGRTGDVLWLTEAGTPVVLLPHTTEPAANGRAGAPRPLLPMPDALRGPVAHHDDLTFHEGRDALVIAGELVDELGDFVGHVLDAFVDAARATPGAALASGGEAAAVRAADRPGTQRPGTRRPGTQRGGVQPGRPNT